MSSTTAFVGQIPTLYDRHLGPVLFDPFARDLARRVPRKASTILEIAAGTGRFTRQLLEVLAANATVLATDLNDAMIACGAALTGDPRVTWQQADALSLPVPDRTVDVVACQFGLMFMPDKPRVLGEMRRALRPGGMLLLSTWNSLPHNPATELLHGLARAAFPDDPPTFMETPFSMSDAPALADLVGAAGFGDVNVETVQLTGDARSAADLAIGMVRGNPLWHQLVERGADAPAFEQAVAEALVARFGDAPCRTPMSAHVVTAVA